MKKISFKGVKDGDIVSLPRFPFKPFRILTKGDQVTLAPVEVFEREALKSFGPDKFNKLGYHKWNRKEMRMDGIISEYYHSTKKKKRG